MKRGTFDPFGTQLHIGYVVSGTNAGSFPIALYASADGVSPDQLLQVVEAGAEMGSVGAHALAFVADFADLSGDYQVIAVLDAGNSIPETNETNNTAPLTALSFVGVDAATEPTCSAERSMAPVTRAAKCGRQLAGDRVKSGCRCFLDIMKAMLPGSNSSKSSR